MGVSGKRYYFIRLNGYKIGFFRIAITNHLEESSPDKKSLQLFKFDGALSSPDRLCWKNKPPR